MSQENGKITKSTFWFHHLFLLFLTKTKHYHFITKILCDCRLCTYVQKIFTHSDRQKQRETHNKITVVTVIKPLCINRSTKINIFYILNFRWNETTLADPLNLSKTCWPVSHIESIFLPQFKIANSESKYTIVDFIARGAFGKVFKVVEKESGTEYALKILSKAQVKIEKYNKNN